jgi:ribosomal protein L28
MKRTTDRTQFSPMCMICGKTAAMGLNKPHSQKRTKRLFRANIQSYHGLLVCTRCLRTLRRDRNEAENKVKIATKN